MSDGPGRGGRVYLDSNIIIYFVERISPWFAQLKRFVATANAKGSRFVTSDLAAAECLLRPYKDGNLALIGIYERFFEGGEEIERWPIDYVLMKQASGLAAKHGLKLIDAVHLASAIASECNVFISNDKSIRAVEELRIVTPSELELL
jgi:predicted nucleic acid-binding protein